VPERSTHSGWQSIATASACNMQVCKNCGTDCTPFWRKDQADQLPLCNACGLYAKKNGSMRPPSLWKQDKQQSQLPTFDAAMQPVAPVVAASVHPVGLQNGQPPFRAAWGGAPMPPQMPGFSGMPHTFIGPLPGPSAAELLQSAGPVDEDIPPPVPTVPAGPLAGYSGASGRSTGSPATIITPSSLPPLPPLASVPPPPPAPVAAPRPPPPAVPAESQPHRSIVMQVSASLARTQPPDGANAPQLLMAGEASSIAATDELGEEFEQAAAAIGTDSDDDVVGHLVGDDDRATSPPAINELERAATAPIGSGHPLLGAREEASRCVSDDLGGGPDVSRNRRHSAFPETRSRRSLATCEV
jgi:hypothetical protein